MVRENLSRLSLYFNGLEEDQKEVFVQRVETFVTEKEFEGRNGLQVTSDMKILIACAATQITFGLSYFRMDFFDRIIIYPSRYYSPFSQTVNVGEVNPKGIIVFSWHELVKGYRNETDNYNVGLHEMAHALELNDLYSNRSDFVFSAYAEKWFSVAKKFLDQKQEQPSYLRKYALVNMKELFAVGVEYFFESPQDFYREHPDLYKHFCLMLNQDPRRNRYEVNYEEWEEKPHGKGKLHFEQSASWTDLVVTSSVFIAFLSIMFVEATVPLALLILCISFMLYFLYRRSTTFMMRIYENVLQLKPYLPWKKRESIPLHKVLSISLDSRSETQNDDTLEIAVYEQGSVRMIKVRISSQRSLSEMFPFLFHEKEIFIRQNGHTLIPREAAGGKRKSGH